ncbi:MAG TPA: hypothetical protein PKA28_16925 [Methylomusa anaerophila]|uniref:Uncharacterized protein n=1 Tax=Methylomusa anaerophila TaxID=1930071 RepID=A0A348AEK6_9FIRM|nr:hypothetical protein [Methylomusa anaerophila]BBB89504.1 hypothetical protein MAMMFC1_00137 [Methylomusa anaerophila]HML90126.1 hypothetical protein [Methylomusa anaerophila]
MELLGEKEKEYLRTVISDAQCRYENISIIDNVTVNESDLKFERIQLNNNEGFALHINSDGDVLPFFSADRTTAIGNINDLHNLIQKLQDTQTFIDLENYKEAMKRRMSAKEKPVNRKIMPEEICF